MLVDSNLMTDTAKVWVYPSSRKFYPQEIDGIISKIETFLNSWKEEDVSFKTSYAIKYDRFIVIYASESTVLMNSDIDQLVGFILELQSELKVELLDRMNVCFKQGNYVQYKDLKEFKKLLKNKSVSAKTIVFDNLISTKDDLDNFWEVPITESWYNRFL